MKAGLNNYLRPPQHVTHVLPQSGTGGVQKTRVRMFRAGCSAIVAGMLFLSPASAKKKEGVDPGEIKKLNAEISRLKKDNKKLDRDLANVDSMSVVESSRTSKLHGNFDKEISRKKNEIQDLNNRHTELQTKINDEKSSQASYRNKIEEVKAREVSSKNLLIELTGELEVRIQNSLPWDQEKRLERIRVLRRDIENNNAGLDEAYTRLKSIYSDEIKLGDEITLQNKPVTTSSGEVINARVLKIGNQWMIYSDEEEKRFGTMSRTLKDGSIHYAWKEDLNFDERDAVRAALDIKSGKKPPGLVSLPLSLSVESSVKGGN